MPDEDIDRWLLAGEHLDLMTAVFEMWQEFKERLERLGVLELGESGSPRLVGLSWT